MWNLPVDSCQCADCVRLRDNLPAQRGSEPGIAPVLPAPAVVVEATAQNVEAGQSLLRPGAVVFASGSAPLLLPPIAAGKKFDGGKAPLAQGCIGYFRKALEGVAQISAYGAKKYNVPYSDQNWRIVDNAKGRYLDALARHLAAHAAGELIDQESGKHHIDMVAWNALALSELSKS